MGIAHDNNNTTAAKIADELTRLSVGFDAEYGLGVIAHNPVDPTIVNMIYVYSHLQGGFYAGEQVLGCLVGLTPGKVSQYPKTTNSVWELLAKFKVSVYHGAPSATPYY